jgi:hypothetical protein
MSCTLYFIFSQVIHILILKCSMSCTFYFMFSQVIHILIKKFPMSCTFYFIFSQVMHILFYFFPCHAHFIYFFPSRAHFILCFPKSCIFNLFIHEIDPKYPESLIDTRWFSCLLLLKHKYVRESIQVIIWEPSNVAWQSPIQTITTVWQLSYLFKLPHTLAKGTKDQSLHSTTFHKDFLSVTGIIYTPCETDRLVRARALIRNPKLSSYYSLCNQLGSC